MNYILLLFAGALLCNGIPHLAAGLKGEQFPTPFARPRGVGESSPLVNFYWGSFNVLLGLQILSRHPVTVGANPRIASVVAGTLVLGTYLALHFGKVRKAKRLNRLQDGFHAGHSAHPANPPFVPNSAALFPYVSGWSYANPNFALEAKSTFDGNLPLVGLPFWAGAPSQERR